MKIAVVIPALDEAHRIAAAVESALPSRGAPRRGPFPPPPSGGGPDVEVVVVDGGSRDDTVARAEAAGARVVRGAPGRARQLRAGAAATSGEVVVFLHADTRLPAGWELAVRDALEDRHVVGGAFRFRFARAEDDGAPAGARERLALGLVAWGARLRGALLHFPYGDQGVFVRREALRAIGGVPQAPLMEDLDLVRALRRRGRLAMLPLDAETSPRRYLSGGVLRTMFRNWLAAAAWRAGLDRARIARWAGR